MSRSFLACLLVASVLLVAGCTGSGSAGAWNVPSPFPTPIPTVRIYLVDDRSDGCDATRWVTRGVDVSSPETALRALLAGPSPYELAEGWSSWFSVATAQMLESVSVVDGVARVSFRDLRPVIPNASSSCGSAALLSALDSTLLQFPEIRSTRYSILGDEAAFYEWLQRGVPET